MANPRDPDAIASVSATLGPALREIGFAILTGHGIDPALFEETHESIPPVFTETSWDTKRRFNAIRKGSVNQGFFGVEETSNLHPDQVEGWVFCRRAFRLGDENACPVDGDHVLKYWPSGELEAKFRRVVEAEEPLVKPVMRAILHNLGADPFSFDEKLTHNNFGFRLNYYPPMTKDMLDRGVGRMLGHEDVDLFTLLPASPVEGLQVLNRKNMKWIRLSAPPGSIILNVGDYLQRISNDVLPSTTHRVAPPRDEELRAKGRTSFPMAVYLDEPVILECLPECGEPHYTPISAIDFHTGITAKYYGDDYRSTGED